VPEKPTPESTPDCPFCRSKDTEVISLFGSQVMTMQCKCRACGNFFEASKY
jgi:transcription elongation factor Elf1